MCVMRRRRFLMPPRPPEECVVFNACEPTAELTPTAPTPTGMDALVPGQAVPLIWERTYDEPCRCS